MNIEAYLTGRGCTKNYTISCTRFEVGRSRTANVCLTDLSVSRSHCEFIFGENKQWLLYDLSSSGTFVNSQLIGKNCCVEVKDEDEINVGPIGNNLCWTFYNSQESFIRNAGRKRRKLNDSLMDPELEAQSQLIENMCVERNNLEEKMTETINKQQYIERQHHKLNQDFDKRIEAIEKQKQQKLLLPSEIKTEVEEELQLEKTKLNEELERQKKILDEEMMKSIGVENQLKQQIECLACDLEAEKTKFEEKLKEEKQLLEQQLKEQQKELEEEKTKMSRDAFEKEKELNDKLKQKEEESKLLSSKIAEMEKLHTQEKAELAAKIKEQVAEKEELVKKQLEDKISEINCMKERLEHQLEEEFMKKEKETEHVEQLLKELDQVKNSLVQVEGKKTVLEKELEAANAATTCETSKVKSELLENIQNLMETELQCSICAELFVIAITLNCSHTFCKFCINRWKEKKKECPVCRTTISTETRSVVMDSYIERMVENLSDEMKEKRKDMIDERNCSKEDENKKKKGKQKTAAGRGDGGATSSRTRPVSSSSASSSDEGSTYSSSTESYDSAEEIDEIPAVYYGGYGACYICGQRGHWANGCPNRRYNR